LKDEVVFFVIVRSINTFIPKTLWFYNRQNS